MKAMCNEAKKKTMVQLLKHDYKETLLTDMKPKIETKVEPPVASTSRKRAPLLSNQSFKIPKVKSNHYLYLEPLVSDHLS